MRHSIEFRLTVKEIAEIITGQRPSIADKFKLDPEDGIPSSPRISWDTNVSEFYISVEGEERNNDQK